LCIALILHCLKEATLCDGSGPGADGHDHLVGVYGRTYAPAQLPMISAGQ
jgi:hypothetical protein